MITNTEKRRNPITETKCRDHHALMNLKSLFIGRQPLSRSSEIITDRVYKKFQNRIAYGIEKGFIIKKGVGDSSVFTWSDVAYAKYKRAVNRKKPL